ncbi:MAG TPA: hypothetical protein PKI76_05735 [Oscillospiraceae bacterium]|nr:hypothetical protein [Oscillospiraceae bacterium]HNW04866.1 hypothetical protein [Oscillospiraceae bacterium]
MSEAQILSVNITKNFGAFFFPKNIAQSFSLVLVNLRRFYTVCRILHKNGILFLDRPRLSFFEAICYDNRTNMPPGGV